MYRKKQYKNKPIRNAMKLTNYINFKKLHLTLNAISNVWS